MEGRFAARVIPALMGNRVRHKCFLWSKGIAGLSIRLLGSWVFGLIARSEVAYVDQLLAKSAGCREREVHTTLTT